MRKYLIAVRSDCVGPYYYAQSSINLPWYVYYTIRSYSFIVYCFKQNEKAYPTFTPQCRSIIFDITLHVHCDIVLVCPVCPFAVCWCFLADSNLSVISNVNHFMTCNRAEKLHTVRFLWILLCKQLEHCMELWYHMGSYWLLFAHTEKVNVLNDFRMGP